MNRKRKKGISVPSGTILLFGAAVGLLLFSAVGSTRAALTYYSETYSAQIDVQSIGVTLLENNQVISYRDYTHADDEWYEASGKLLQLPEEEKWQIGRTYDAELKVRNSGVIDEYVRVKLYKYWVDKEGKRLPYLSPALIDLHLLTDGGWILDENATTAHVREGDGRDGERIVLYYDRVLTAVDENGSYDETSLFADSITIDSSVATKVTEYKSADGSKITTVYDYDGASFVLEAEVDAVQTHNAENAIRSAWGVDVEIGQDGSLRLK